MIHPFIQEDKYHFDPYNLQSHDTLSQITYVDDTYQRGEKESAEMTPW